MSESILPSQSKLRFEFGENWTRFLSVVNETHIAMAQKKLAEAVGDIRGKTFLDVGCGSGIHSLSAVRLGAARVHSFDFDPKSVSCSREMKRRFTPDPDWTIEQGSALNAEYLRSLGQFDIVYSWGVLHHTGDMWTALDLVTIPQPKTLMIAIYHDDGSGSKFWKSFKRTYNRVWKPVRKIMEAAVFGWAWVRPFMLHPGKTRDRWKKYVEDRGMSPWYDVVDWAGGYPYEVARPEDIESFYRERGFKLTWSKLTGSGGCNEFVFTRTDKPLAL